MSTGRLLLENYAGVTVATFNDSSILDTLVIDQLGKELFRLPEEMNVQKLVLDFSNVKFMGSHTLGILVTLNKKVQATKGQLALCAMRPELKKVFTITSLDKLFKFFPDDAAALASFGVRVT